MTNYKRCISVQTPEFAKVLKKLKNKKASDRILKKIEDLIEAENNSHILSKNSDGTSRGMATDFFGKRLDVNKDVYSLMVAQGEGLRALAIVVEEKNVKMYVWFWGGGHNDYDCQIKSDRLKKNASSVKSAKEQENGYIQQILKQNEDDNHQDLKEDVKNKIHKIRKKSFGNTQEKDFKYN